MADVLIKDLSRQLRELQEGARWFDQSYREKMDLVSDSEAFVRPLPEIHSVAEQISHVIEWRKESLRRFEGWRTELMHAPEDWRTNEELRAEGWGSLKQRFFESTRQMLEALKEKDDSFLEIDFKEEGYDFHAIIEGIIQHDLYHLGQIGLAIRLLRCRSPHGD